MKFHSLAIQNLYDILLKNLNVMHIHFQLKVFYKNTKSNIGDQHLVVKIVEYFH
jgi:hypothetical protein